MTATADRPRTARSSPEQPSPEQPSPEQPSPGPGQHTAAGQHGELGDELRLLGRALLDRYEPQVRAVLAGLRVEAAEAAAAGVTDPPPASCGWCPMCAAVGLVRGERPELGGRIAEHGDSLLTLLRAIVDPPAERPDGRC